MHEKALTADILEIKGWEHNVVCPLCFKEAESNHHLLIACEYAREVMQHICSWMHTPPTLHQVVQGTTVHTWFDTIIASAQADQRKDISGRLLYGWWSIWKERNRRIFQGVEKSSLHVALLAKEEADQREMANKPMQFDPG